MNRIAHRGDAIYPATVVGKPRQEDFFIGDLLQELLSPLFPLVMPAVEQLWSYGETGYHSLSAAVVKQRYKREAMASAFRILGEGQLSLTKFLLADRPPRGPEELPRDARAPAGPDPARDRPLRVLEPVDGHARLHRTDGQRRFEGRLDRDWAIRCATCRGSSRPPTSRRASATSASSVAAAWWSAVRPTETNREAAARIAGHPAFARLAARRADRRTDARDPQRHEFPVDDVHPVRAGGRHLMPRNGASSATTSRIRARSSSTPG